MNDREWKQFEKAIKLVKKNALFRTVIKSATGHSILEFDDEHLKLIKIINNWINKNLSHISKKIKNDYKGRANELGNTLENELRTQLNGIDGIACKKPLLASGKNQSSGYPDCMFELNHLKIYADIKTYKSGSENSSFRSFFYQSTQRNKIHYDAPHCLIAFETKSLTGGNKSPFEIISYKIIDLYDLKIKLKAEFNASNKDIYYLKQLK
jgi:hypothetical protein